MSAKKCFPNWFPNCKPSNDNFYETGRESYLPDAQPLLRVNRTKSDEFESIDNEQSKNRYVLNKLDVLKHLAQAATQADNFIRHGFEIPEAKKYIKNENLGTQHFRLSISITNIKDKYDVVVLGSGFYFYFYFVFLLVFAYFCICVRAFLFFCFFFRCVFIVLHLPKHKIFFGD